MRKGLAWLAGLAVAGWVVFATVRGWRASAPPNAITPYVYAPLLITLGCWLGWLAARRLDPRLLAAGVATVAAYVALAALLTNHPGRGAIGYANANAALAVQLIGLAGLLTLSQPARRIAWGAAAAGLLALLANASTGGTATAVIVMITLALATLMPNGRRRWPALLASLMTCALAVATVVTLGRRSNWPDSLLSTLSPIRRELWNTAWSAYRQAETLGYGPGGFAQINDLAGDPDTASAHSLPLQVAAELGGLGLVLLTLLFLCGLAVAAQAATVPAAWIASGAWTALAAHSFMDHLLEYWPICLVAGLVLGVALAGTQSASGSGSNPSPRPSASTS